MNTAPTKPGAPTSDENANRDGTFSLDWEPSSDADGDTIMYALLHRPANDGFTAVRRRIIGSGHAFESGSPEVEGTFIYRVIASDGERSSVPSDDSPEVKVDKTAPNPPAASVPPPFWHDPLDPFDPASGWHRDSVTVTFASAGDPNLADASTGSGVDSSSVGPAQTFSTSGEHQASDTVLDIVGNESAPATRTLKVDATAPSVSLSCPQSVSSGSSATAIVSATDGESGLAQDPSGTRALDTATTGVRTLTVTAADRVAHTTTASCNYLVISTSCFEGFFPPIDNPQTGKMNGVKAGSAVPVKFSLCGDEGLDIFAPNSPSSRQITCATQTPIDQDTPTTTAGNSSLSYSPGDDRYTYVWKTDKGWTMPRA